MIKKISVSTSQKKQVVDLTNQINAILNSQAKSEGVCSIMVTHTTCGLTTGEIGEGTDADLLEVMEEIIPRIDFRHAHDPSHAWTHMGASILGCSLSIPFEDKKLILGTWQSILLVELDGPRERTVVVHVED